jgi:hypothetical protein
MIDHCTWQWLSHSGCPILPTQPTTALPTHPCPLLGTGLRHLIQPLLAAGCEGQEPAGGSKAQRQRCAYAGAGTCGRDAARACLNVKHSRHAADMQSTMHAACSMLQGNSLGTCLCQDVQQLAFCGAVHVVHMLGVSGTLRGCCRL